MTKGTRLLLHRLTHPTKMLTLGTNQAMLASHAAPSRRSIQGTAAAPAAAGTAGRPCAHPLPLRMLECIVFGFPFFGRQDSSFSTTCLLQVLHRVSGAKLVSAQIEHVGGWL